MKHRLIICCASLFAAPAAFACSLAVAVPFEPTLERWDQHPGPAQLNEESDGAYWEGVPTPVVEVVSITRGSVGPGDDCADAGIIELEVSLPETSAYHISEFAVYFRVVRGTQPDEIFPDVPLVGSIEGDKALLLLAWLDGHPRDQAPLELEVEAFLVTNGLNIGPPTRFHIDVR